MTFVHTCREHGWVNCPMCKVKTIEYFGKPKEALLMDVFILEIKKLIEKTPNDQELGAKIRKLWNTL